MKTMARSPGSGKRHAGFLHAYQNGQRLVLMRFEEGLQGPRAGSRRIQSYRERFRSEISPTQALYSSPSQVAP